MLLVRGRISQKHSFLCAILAVLGSQGIVVKCTAAIFFLTEDYNTWNTYILLDILVCSIAVYFYESCSHANDK